MESGNGRMRKLDIVKEIIFFLLVTAVAFAWWMLMLLLISFLTLSVLHFSIEGIFILATVGTIGTDIVYVVSKVKQHRKHS